MDLDMTLAMMKGMKNWIDDMLDATTYDDHADLRGLNADQKDSDQLFQLRELQAIMGKLADISDSIAYLFRPVQEISTLHKDENGEYRTEKGYCYRSGILIEVLIQGDSNEIPRWVQTRVEHDGEDYYLLGHDDIPMEGLRVRVR